MKNFTVVGFGASTVKGSTGMPDKTKRWLNVLAALLSREFPGISFNIINSGIGGESCREAMLRLDRDVLNHNPDMVLVLVCGNNSDPYNPGRRVGPDEFMLHMETLAAKLPESAIPVFITMQPVLDSHPASGHPFYTRQGGIDASFEKYRELTRRFALDRGYPLVDFHHELLRLMKKNPPERYIRHDGIHLTETGNRVLAESVFAVLKPLLARSLTENSG